ncbi:MAG: FAD-binding protein [Chloroflexi bacterium]|nr:FAD-binding protein [Chloroflexota bacterium]
MVQENIETDVVVVGYGAAGAAAAISAHDAGANVAVLEKMAEGGGNSKVGGANIIIPRDMRFLDYLDTISFKTTPRDALEVFVKGTIEIPAWIRKLGGELQPFELLAAAYPLQKGSTTFPHVAGGENIQRYCVKGSGSEGTPAERLWKLLSGNVNSRGIKVLFNSRAVELVKNGRGQISGVLTESGMTVKARKGVILTCGGYENNDALKWDYLPAKPVRFMGNPGNTGDGIRMVQKIGADLWHMTRLSCGLGFQAPGFEAAFGIFFFRLGFIYVDKRGSRFVNETGVDSHVYGNLLSAFDDEHFDFPRIPFHAIFDEEVVRAGPMNPGTSGYNKNKYKWSLDNKEEIKKGWITSAKKLSELAQKIGVEQGSLEATINRYNEQCKAGSDADFGRAKEHLKHIQGPYYAIQLWPTLLNTQGGPRRDKEARVLDTEGKPIAGLFAAGELGSLWGFGYQTACNIAECIVFGQIAGNNAANSPVIEN